MNQQPLSFADVERLSDQMKSAPQLPTDGKGNYVFPVLNWPLARITMAQHPEWFV